MIYSSHKCVLILVALTMLAGSLLSGCRFVRYRSRPDATVDIGIDSGRVGFGVGDSVSADGSDGSPAHTDKDASIREASTGDDESSVSDDASWTEEPAGELRIKGAILCDGNGVEGVSVYLLDENPDYGENRSVIGETITDRLGEYIFSKLREGVYFVHPVSPDYVFEPTKREIDLYTDVTGVVFLAFTIPPHAQGSFRVVESDCWGNDCLVRTCGSSTSYSVETGSVLEFENGCLFGNARCVDGSQYYKSVFCGDPMDPFLYPGLWKSFQSLTVSGEFDEETGTWQLETEYCWGGWDLVQGFFCTTSHISLERIE